MKSLDPDTGGEKVDKLGWMRQQKEPHPQILYNYRDLERPSPL
jgi:hypothetical protein